MNDDIVTFKSTPINWHKEYDSRKPKTLRKVDNSDDRFYRLRDIPEHLIKIVNTKTGESFVRKVTDYTERDGYAITSWKHSDISIQKEKPVAHQPNITAIWGYCEKHDAHFYIDKDEWAEKKCSDKTCEFCFNRPAKPSQCIGHTHIDWSKE